VTLEQIFADVGLTADQIRAVTAHVPIANEPPKIIEMPQTNRPKCLVCGRPIGLRTCVIMRYSTTNSTVILNSI